VKFDDLMPRFVSTHQFDTIPRTIQSSRQQPNQCFVCRSIHGRRGDSDAQFVADPVIGNYFIGRRARLEFHGKQDTIRLRAKELGNGRVCHFTPGKSFARRIDEPEGPGHQRKAGGKEQKRSTHKFNRISFGIHGQGYSG
jgi:hypothetical protein